jgi:hypothetical protein
MATEFSMLSIMNAALVSRGWDEIVSVDDGTPEFRAMARNWPLIVEAELEDGLYSFTRKQADLQTRMDGQFGFTDAYLVPMKALHVRHLWVAGSDGSKLSVDWSQDGTHVYVNNSTGCMIEYLEAAEAHQWGANFSRGVQYMMEAVLIRAFEGEDAEARSKEAMAAEAFQRARTISSKSRSPSKVFTRTSIASARFSRGS